MGSMRFEVWSMSEDSDLDFRQGVLLSKCVMLFFKATYFKAVAKDPKKTWAQVMDYPVSGLT